MQARMQAKIVAILTHDEPGEQGSEEGRGGAGSGYHVLEGTVWRRHQPQQPLAHGDKHQ